MSLLLRNWSRSGRAQPRSKESLMTIRFLYDRPPDSQAFKIIEIHLV